ncbi:MAG: BTAD domain-containing putative transcriptional regulator [Chloroflexota bacterium]
MSKLRVFLFGPFQAVLDGATLAEFKSSKVRALLAYLIAESDCPHSRGRLAGLLWPDWPEAQARDNLRYALSDLRRAIGDRAAQPPFLHISRDAIQFNTHSDYEADASQFSTLLAGSKVTSPDPADLEKAVALYRGEFLEGFAVPGNPDFDEWVTFKREQFHLKLVEALHRLSAVYEENGDYEHALTHARRLVALEPWQEQGHQQVMRNLAHTGQRAAALAHYENLRQLLDSDLGVEPGPQTRQLYQHLLADDWQPAKTAPPQAAKSVIQECPYRGLAAFQESDARFFFGRQEVVERLVQAANRPTSMIAVIGASGSGKSSLIFAGLVPRLRQEKRWLVASFRPGSQPFHALASALVPLLEPQLPEVERLVVCRKAAGALEAGELHLPEMAARLLDKHPNAERLCLVVDQFEELYTLCPQGEARQRFVDELLALAQPARSPGPPACTLLLALRADFMSQALAQRSLADALQSAAHLLGPMSREDLRQAIEKPAEMLGAAFEAGLVDRILDDVAEQPGSLPLLEFTLTMLWERQVDGWMQHAAYEALGKVKGALTRYAGQALAALDEGEQKQAQAIFLQLVQPGEGTEDTRRIARRDEIGEQNWPITQRLADARLVVTGLSASGEQVVEIIHEVLIQHWERLRMWIEASRGFRNWQEGLRAVMRQWQASGRDEGALLRGAPLAQAETWLGEHAGQLSPLEGEFIQASMALHQRRRLEEQRKQQEELQAARQLALSERRSRRFLGALAAVLTIATLVALSLAFVTVRQRRLALEAYSLSLAANARSALENLDVASGLVLALAANRIDRPPIEAQRILMQAAYSPGPRQRFEAGQIFPGLEAPITCLVISPNGRQALAGFQDGSLALWEIETGTEIQRFYGHPAEVNDLAFTPDGSQAVSAGGDGAVIVWDLSSGKEILRFVGHSGPVKAVDISPDGRSVVSGGFSGDSGMNPGELILWDLATGREIRCFTGHTASVVDARFSPDGMRILASSGDPTLVLTEGTLTIDYRLILWEGSTGEIVREFQNLENDASSIAFSPDGAKALTGSAWYYALTLWDLSSGEALAVFTGHTNTVRQVFITPDGRKAISASEDQSLLLWDLASGEALARLKAHDSGVQALALSPDGRTAISAAYHGDLIIWDLLDAAEVRHYLGHQDMVFDVDFTPDGQQFVSCSGAATPGTPSRDSSLRLWNVESGAQIRKMELPGEVSIFQVVVSPDGRSALSGSTDGLLRLWNLQSGAELHQFAGHGDMVTDLAFTPDGNKALSASVNTTLILWDVRTGAILHHLNGHTQGVWGVAINPDGRTALSTGDDGWLILWDLESGQEIRRYPARQMAYVPDGRTALVTDTEDNLAILDLESGERIRQIGQHRSFRTRLLVLPGAHTAFSSGWEGTLKLWDLERGELIRQFGYTSPVSLYDIAVSPDGRYALSGASDQEIILWRLSNPGLEELLLWVQANRYVRPLTCDERKIYQIEPLCEQ